LVKAFDWQRASPVNQSAIYKSHRGERSSDLNRLPIASRRQCQTSVFALETVGPALFLGSLLLTCRRDDSVGVILALASRQRRFSTFLAGSGAAATVSGTSGGVSAGVSVSVVADSGGTLASIATRALGSGSLSDFVSSFGTAAGSTSLASAVGAAADAANGPAVLIAIAAPTPTTQNSANQIVLDIANGKAPAVWRRLGANLQDRIRADWCNPAACHAMFPTVSTQTQDMRIIGLI
jgi:hypothetical protein